MDMRKTLCVLSRTQPQYFLQWNQLQSAIQNSALILIVFLSLCEAIISDDLIVETTKGKIRGVTLKSATNKYVVLIDFLNGFLSADKPQASALQVIAGVRRRAGKGIIFKSQMSKSTLVFPSIPTKNFALFLLSFFVSFSKNSWKVNSLQLLSYSLSTWLAKIPPSHSLIDNDKLSANVTKIVAATYGNACSLYLFQ